MSAANPAQLVVDTQVFVKLIENSQQQTDDTRKQTEAIVETMDAFRKTLGEHSKCLLDHKMEMSRMDARITALENAKKFHLEDRKPSVSSTVFHAPAPNLKETIDQPTLLNGGKYQCPRCLKNYTPGYILQHMANRKNRNCVNVTVPAPGPSSVP